MAIVAARLCRLDTTTHHHDSTVLTTIPACPLPFRSCSKIAPSTTGAAAHPAANRSSRGRCANTQPTPAPWTQSAMRRNHLPRTRARW